MPKPLGRNKVRISAAARRLSIAATTPPIWEPHSKSPSGLAGARPDSGNSPTGTAATSRVAVWAGRWVRILFGNALGAMVVTPGAGM
jgi:hypothetical protein